MAYDLEKFGSGTMDKGVQVQTSIFNEQPVLNEDASNMTQGLQIGLGPRYGVSPIPGQLGTEAVSGSGLPNMQLSEASGAPAGNYFIDRVKCYGIVPLKLPDPADITKFITCYAFIFSTTDTGSGAALDVEIASTFNSGSAYEIPSADIRTGFGVPSTDNNSGLQGGFFIDGLTPKSTNLLSLRAFLALTDANTNFISYASAVAGGGNVPTQWLLGLNTTSGGLTTAPSAAFQEVPSGMSVNPFCGVPTEYNLQTFTTAIRQMKIFALTAAGDRNIDYSVSVSPSATTFISDINAAGTTTLDLSAITASKDTGGTTYSDTKGVLVNDQMSVSSSAYKAILMAANTAYACIFQDGFRSPRRRHQQWYDLTANNYKPLICSSVYTENGVALTKTSFAAWPTFVRGTAMAAASNGGPALGAAGTGILRANTVYEFTYSIYNKRLNFESNVGTPVKIQVGSADFVGLELFNSATLHATQMANTNGTGVNPLPYQFDKATFGTGSYAPSDLYINFVQYRFYYRAEGTFEWLPALQVDASQYWYYPGFGKLVACNGAAAGSVGGQPGGFNDYSELPRDSWVCVVVYKNRSFWVSNTQIQFSLYNNFFSYPGRNSAACPSGQFRGALLHNYPGQAQQDARLIVFGTETIYVGRFTGNLAQQSVQVSPDATGVFDVDGSDFVLDAWTSVTAFSYRSAIVADGILHWWGPQGVFRDDGVQTPTRISDDLEPNIFKIYDSSRILEINATYNNQTKEIIWYYYASDAATTMSMMIYNVRSGNFTFGAIDAAVDWAAQLNVDSAINTAGLRMVVGTRASSATTLQRAYFFDQNNRSGDMRPKHDMVVKTVADSGAFKRLTLASGFDATAFQSIAVGDYIALQQTTNYSGLTADDMVATVAATSASAGTIDLTLPTGATLATGSLTIAKQFPIWHRAAAGVGLNGFNYQLSTGYWGPAGINGYFFWYYWYLLAKMNLWLTTETPGWSLGYRSPTALDYLTDFSAFADNSDGNFQLYHPLAPGNDNMEGQGLKLKVSGIHIGHEWVLQYMEIHGKPFDGDPLKRFEG